MDLKKEIQEKIIRYQILDGRIKALLKKRDLLVAKIIEIETTLNAMEEIEKSKEREILLPLGSNVHVPGALQSTGKAIVEIGADIAIEEDFEGAKKILEERKSIISNGLQTTEDEIVNLSNELVKLEPEIRTLIEKGKTD
jgi:prefoldin alpha subunit